MPDVRPGTRRSAIADRAGLLGERDQSAVDQPRSPTPTGKVERWHKTLRRELLDHVAPFESLTAAQEAIDAWVHTYNHSRPHQALNMATPASVFRPHGPHSDRLGRSAEHPPPPRRARAAHRGLPATSRRPGHPGQLAAGQAAKLPGARAAATPLPPPPLPAGSCTAEKNSPSSPAATPHPLPGSTSAAKAPSRADVKHLLRPHIVTPAELLTPRQPSSLTRVVIRRCSRRRNPPVGGTRTEL
jgi:hypothetical protein